MIGVDDVQLITRVYRLQKLVVSPDLAPERTYILVRGFCPDREEVLKIIAAEDERRRKLLEVLRATEKELGEL